MRFSRLFVLSLVFTGFALSAQAQYTSRSPTPAETATKTGTTTAAPAAKTNPYTGTGAATAAPAAKQQQPQPAQAVFRPRPQPAVMPQTAGDDELPSFDALEKPVAAAQGSAQGSNLPPPPPPKGEIWFYTTDFSYRDLTGRTMNCTWKVVLQNKTDTEIKQLKVVYTLLGEKIPSFFSKVAPNSSVVATDGMFSEKCPAISQTKPKVEIVTCKMGTATGQDCSKYIVIK